MLADSTTVSANYLAYPGGECCCHYFVMFQCHGHEYQDQHHCHCYNTITSKSDIVIVHHHKHFYCAHRRDCYRTLYLVQVEGAFHELRSQRVLLLVGVQLPMRVHEALRKGIEGSPQGEVVPVRLLGCQQVSRQNLHACTC